jgi:predicted MFS family arabinose efflux permease
MTMLPAGAGTDAARLIAARALRGFCDGWVSVLLAGYLAALGLSTLEISAIVTGTLLGSAAVTLGVGLIGHRLPARRGLEAATLLMLGTGVGFLSLRSFWPLLVVAVVGTLNPSAGDVSLFLPLEQAALSARVAGTGRTALFARYNLGGALAGALGALASGVPSALGAGAAAATAMRLGLMVYVAAALASAWLYRGLQSTDASTSTAPAAAPLGRSRRVVLELAALFSLDAFGGGFVVQSLLVLWLHRRFALSPEVTGAVFFATGLCGAFSQLGSSWLAERIGLVETMVYTHLPSNVLLVLTGLMPTAPLAVGCLLLRTCISQMDVPARQSYVMAVVSPEERAAAASVTNVPRSLAASLSPLLAGVMLEHSDFGWPLVCAGVLKGIYDLLLFARFRALRAE